MFCPASSGREPEFWEAWNRSRGHPRSREGQEVIAKNSRILTSLLRIRIPPGSMWEPSAVRGSEGLPFCYECSDKSSALIHLSQGCRLKRNRRPSKLLILSEPAFLARCPRRSSGNRSGPVGGGSSNFHADIIFFPERGRFGLEASILIGRGNHGSLDESQCEVNARESANAKMRSGISGEERTGENPRSPDLREARIVSHEPPFFGDPHGGRSAGSGRLFSGRGASFVFPFSCLFSSSPARYPECR